MCESSVPTCCRLDFLFRAEFAMHRSLSAAIPARSMVITYLVLQRRLCVQVPNRRGAAQIVAHGDDRSTM
jgi:hypothetical protein